MEMASVPLAPELTAHDSESPILVILLPPNAVTMRVDPEGMEGREGLHVRATIVPVVHCVAPFTVPDTELATLITAATTAVTASTALTS